MIHDLREVVKSKWRVHFLFWMDSHVFEKEKRKERWLVQEFSTALPGGCPELGQPWLSLGWVVSQQMGVLCFWHEMKGHCNLFWGPGQGCLPQLNFLMCGKEGDSKCDFSYASSSKNTQFLSKEHFSGFHWYMMPWKYSWREEKTEPVWHWLWIRCIIYTFSIYYLSGLILWYQRRKIQDSTVWDSSARMKVAASRVLRFYFEGKRL